MNFWLIQVQAPSSQPFQSCQTYLIAYLTYIDLYSLTLATGSNIYLSEA